MRPIRSPGRCALACALTCAAWARPGGAHEPPEPPPPPPPAEEAPGPVLTGPVYETRIVGERAFSAASSTAVRDRDFLLRTHPRPADILQVTPGIYVAQHAGGGKANQYFLRGFDADHGTDVALFVDGVPVNAVSHGHGQGYADLNWVIPEVIRRIEVHKGIYDARFGDFATAGAINLVSRATFDTSSLTLGGGSFGTYRAAFATGGDHDGWQPMLVGTVYGTDGPFEHGEDLQRYSLFTKVTRRLDGGGRLSLAFTGYGAGWDASNQIPLRAVRAGTIGRFGTIDPTDGGASQRQSLYATFHKHLADEAELRILAYLVSSRLRLFSNFTFFSVDPIDGDQIEQDDLRTTAGLDGSWKLVHRARGMTFLTTAGAQARTDAIATDLWHTSARRRLEHRIDADVRQASLAVFASSEASWTSWLRTVVGVRADYFNFEVDDLNDPRNSGIRDAMMVSPKANVVLSVNSGTDLFLNFGTGFHSNDARGVVRPSGAVTPMTRAIGGEIGVRTKRQLGHHGRLDLAAAAFVLDLDGEIVWVGDEGTTEARGATRRLGLEAEARAQLTSWLFADVDATLSRARFVDAPAGADEVPLAPRLTLQAGVSARHHTGFSGRVGVFHLGDRPATEDGFLTAEGFTRVDATAGYTHDRFEVTVELQNALDSELREAQFATASRLQGETTCPAGTREVDGACEDLSFTPGAPFNVQVTATLFF